MEHGVRRTKALDPAQATAKKQQEADKIEAYQRVCQPLLELNRARDYAPQHLPLSAELVDLNPEMPTAWAFRRRVLLNHPSSELPQLLKQDLLLTLKALRRNPKTYSVWEHRSWVLDHFAEPERSAQFHKELALIDGFLQADARNFHGWDYRRHVLERCPAASSSGKEWDYTTSKISSSFSNFSAWHYRAQLLAGKLKGAGADQAHSALQAEFELVRQALYTDPADQSGWLYHRLLLSYCPEHYLTSTLETEIASIEELAELEEGDPATLRWALNALVTYKRQLASMLAAGQDESARISDLRRAAKEACVALESLDPARGRRYRYLHDQE